MARDRVDKEEMMAELRNSTTNTLDTISRRVEAARLNKVDNTKITVDSPSRL